MTFAPSPSDPAARSSATAFCRFCHAFCGITVELVNGRAAKVIGDVENPLYHGYSCSKGRALPEQHYGPARLLWTQRRTADATYESMPVDDALDEIADRLTTLIAEHGARSVAMYTGTYSFHYPTGATMAKAFMAAIGSPMRFSSGAIDQPGKGLAKAFHGTWGAGPQPFDHADTWLLVGANPTVSMWGGIPQYNPAKRLREAKARGMKLIVIDPRRTEAAQNADLFLQPKPGEDPTILAALVRVILDEGLADEQFVEAETTGIEALRAAVDPFTPEYAAGRAGVPADSIVAAARLFASGTVGSVTAGTGPNMAHRGALTEYLIACLQSVCGRWVRAGEPIANPFVLLPQRDFVAGADPPIAATGYGEQLRMRGLGDGAGGMPTAALADEILLEGDGQVRALLCVGGNPAVAWPDQTKALTALGALDLLVTLDMKMSATAQFADYVIAPKLGLECDGITLPNETIWGYGPATTGFPVPYAQWHPAISNPPDDSEVIEEWEFFFRLAQRMGLQLRFAGVELDMATMPTTDDLHHILCRKSRVPLDEVKRHPHGHVFTDPSIVAAPRPDAWPHRLQLGHPAMMDELAVVAAEPLLDHAGLDDEERFSHRLVSRRLPHVYNSNGLEIAALRTRHPYNAAYMHPDDMDACGFRSGQIIEIDSGHAQINAVVDEAADVRPGVISMAHAWGGDLKLDDDPYRHGSNTGRLTANDRWFDPISGIPVMSAIPVNVRSSDLNLTTPDPNAQRVTLIGARGDHGAISS